MQLVNIVGLAPVVALGAYASFIQPCRSVRVRRNTGLACR